MPAVALTLLEDKTPKHDGRPTINGWRRKGTDLPALLTNASDKTEQIPGTVAAHGVAVHPLPKEFVAAVWKSPIAGPVRVTAKIRHAHPACGNGVAWRLEHRRAERAAVLAEGTVDLGKEANAPPKTVKVEKDDLLLLAVDARDGNHICDLTEITLTITEADKPGRDLGPGRAMSPTMSSPAIRTPTSSATRTSGASCAGRTPGCIHGQRADRPGGFGAGPLANGGRRSGDAERSGRARRASPNPVDGAAAAGRKGPGPRLYDNLVTFDSPLLQGLDLARLGKPRPGGKQFGLAKERFGKSAAADDASLVVPANSVTEVRLPAALFRGREFVVEGEARRAGGDAVVQFQVLTAPPGPRPRWDGKSPVVASPTGAGLQATAPRATRSSADVFPLFICFPQVIPTDEVVCLKMFHREDEPLARLFLDERAETPPRPPLGRAPLHQPAAGGREQVPAAVHRLRDAGPAQGTAGVLRGAAAEPSRSGPRSSRRRWRRRSRSNWTRCSTSPRGPIAGRCRRRKRPICSALYQTLRKKGVAHEEAFRGVLARVLVSPAFLFRIEQAPAGQGARPGQRLGTGHAAELLPVVVGARRRAAPARRGRQAPRPEGARRADPAHAQGRPPRGRWPSSSARSGFTSAASTNSRKRTRSCSRPSTPNFARRSTRNRSCSSRTCSRTTAP